MLDKSKPPHEIIIEKVAEAKKVDPIELPPMYDVIDPDALDALCDSNEDLRIEFGCCGYEITVEGSDNIEITPLP